LFPRFFSNDNKNNWGVCFCGKSFFRLPTLLENLEKVLKFVIFFKTWKKAGNLKFSLDNLEKLDFALIYSPIELKRPRNSSH